MLKTVGRRILIAVPMLIVIATLTFLLVQLMPGDPVASILGDDATPEQYDTVRAELGLDRPPVEQYATWMLNAAQGDLGESLRTGRSVTETIAERFPVTLSISILGIIITAIVGVLLGLVSALRGGRVGKFSQVLSLFGDSIPNFWLGILLVLVFSITLGVLPATGYVPITESPSRWFISLILPMVTVAFAGIAAVARQTRASMNETLGKDYIRTLRAAGTPRSTIVFKHALRNASIPVVTTLGFQFIAVFGGAIVVEQVFALPGIGQLTMSSVVNLDIPMIQGVVLYSAALVIGVNLIVDVLYAVLNPKVRK